MTHEHLKKISDDLPCMLVICVYVFVTLKSDKFYTLKMDADFGVQQGKSIHEKSPKPPLSAQPSPVLQTTPPDSRPGPMDEGDE